MNSADTAGLGCALVTGGTSGIGLAIASRLLARGFADVIVTGRTAPQLAGLPGEERLSFLRIDHGAPDAAEAVAAELGRRGVTTLAALVNNVGRRHNDTIGSLRRESLLETFSLNVISHMLLTQCLVPQLAAAGGAVVNVSSRLASVGMEGVSGYAASKGALNSFTIAAAVELAPRRIRVNAVAPGMTKTPLIEEWLAEQADPDAAEAEVVGRVPLARLAEPADIAGAAVFLASPESGYVTGTVLHADGGYTVS